MLPLAVGALIAEGIFASLGQRGDTISLPAAGLALLLLWMGVAWALRSWVVLLMTFVPAIMVALGGAMVGDLAPGAGGALLLVGTALIGAVIAFRLSSPMRQWNSGWSAPGTPRAGRWSAVGSWQPSPPSSSAGSAGGAHSAGGAGSADSTDNAGSAPGADKIRGVPGVADAAGARWRRSPWRPLDPLGAHFLRPIAPIDPPERPEASKAPPEPDRPAPAWDTSGTNIEARDRFVALLCRRGGAAGPAVATLEEFFIGNGDPRSIAPGLRGTVPLATIAATLHRLRNHPGVAEVLVQIEPLEAGRYPAGEWPVAGSVHIVATLDADDLDQALAPLHAEPVIGPLPATQLASGEAAPAGSGEFAVWWA